MTPEALLLFLLLAAMIYLFMSERLPIDLTAFLGLLILLLAGYVTAEQAFTGFASSTVITMLSIFVIGGALKETGVTESLAARLHGLIGNREVPLLLGVMGMAGMVSAFLNNLAATAVLMPAVGSISRRSGLSPSRLFMPLAFGTILGGTLTLVGTAPNLLASELLVRHGLRPFRLFDFTALGAVLLAAGILFMVTLGRRLLPIGPKEAGSLQMRELTRFYELQEHLFSVRIPSGSPLVGRTLSEARLGTTLEIQVVAFFRGKEKILSPTADSVIREGDTLLVEGRLQDLQKLLEMQGVEVYPIQAAEIPRPQPGATGARIRIASDSTFVGRDLRSLKFRERLGAMVLAIKRGDEIIRQGLARRILRAGDEVLVLGIRSELEALASLPGVKLQELGLSALDDLREQLYLIRIPRNSSLIGKTLSSSRLGELAGVTVGGLIRDGKTRLGPAPDAALEEGDQLLVTGAPSRILSLLEMGDVRIDSEIDTPVLESEEIGVVEAVVSPRSSIAGRTLGQVRFRERYGLQVLSLWREGRAMHGELSSLTLRFGDALLLQGPWEKIRLLADDPEFVILSQTLQGPRRTEKAPVAVLGLATMIFLILTGLQPVHVASFAGAVLVLLAGALKMEEAYRVIDWRSIFLVAAIFPFSIAMEQTGAISLLAASATGAASLYGPLALLAALVVFSSFLSQALDGALAVLLLVPIAIQSAAELGVSPYPLSMGVALGASMVFLTPFSGKSSLLVMNAGGYRTMDFFKVGAPLTIPLILLVIYLIPLFFPF